MRRKRIAVFLAVVVVAIAASLVSAGFVNWNSVNVSIGNSITLRGILVGLGNDVVNVDFTGYATVSAMCVNNGGNEVPGRNPIHTEVSKTKSFTPDDNGRASVQLTLKDPSSASFVPSPTPKEAGCPNGNWSAYVIQGSTVWTGADVVVVNQDGGRKLINHFTCYNSYCTMD